IKENTIRRRRQTFARTREAELRQRYLSQMPAIISDLESSIHGASSDSDNRTLLAEAIMQAHKISGTAGSYGFALLGQTAAQLEEELQVVSRDTPGSLKLRWQNILGLLQRCKTCAQESKPGHSAEFDQKDKPD